MTPEQLAKVKRQWESYVREETEGMIRNACDIPYGQNYKRYVPLMDLINYKIDAGSVYGRRDMDKNTFKFQKFIDTIDTFVVLVASKWPFIDIDGIDLTWTSEQIVEKMVEMYGSVPVLKFDGIAPPYKDNTEDVNKIIAIFEKHIGPHANKRKKISKTLELKKSIVEARGVEIPKKETRWGLEEDYSSLKDVYEPIIKAIENELKSEFPGENFYISEWSSINRTCKSYTENHKF